MLKISLPVSHHHLVWLNMLAFSMLEFCRFEVLPIHFYKAEIRQESYQLFQTSQNIRAQTTRGATMISRKQLVGRPDLLISRCNLPRIKHSSGSKTQRWLRDITELFKHMSIR